MNESYFVVVMTDGSVKDFDKKCNLVESFNNAGTMINCRQNLSGGRRVNLAIIPVNQIYSIDRYEE